MQVQDRELRSFEGRDPILLVFAHGWKHDAAASDTNLVAFQDLLAGVACEESKQTSQMANRAVPPSAMAGAGPRPVLGVFMSWRGLSRSGNWLWEQSSFWDRQEAAQRVALGSVREALGRLKEFRNPPVGAASTEPRAIIIGHSFGGLVVYAAVAQSLIEAAASGGTRVPSFGDLVLLVNPAFSAVSYLPIHEILQRARYQIDQLPVFVSVTAENDWATGIAFPAGNWMRLLSEATRGEQQASALIRTMGHLDWMRTHALSATATALHPGLAGSADTVAVRARVRGLSKASQIDVFGNVEVRSLSDRPPGPFWTASATPDVIDGHNGIFKPSFVSFVHALVAAHLAQHPSKAAERA